MKILNYIEVAIIIAIACFTLVACGDNENENDTIAGNTEFLVGEWSVLKDSKIWTHLIFEQDAKYHLYSGDGGGRSESGYYSVDASQGIITLSNRVDDQGKSITPSTIEWKFIMFDKNLISIEISPNYYCDYRRQ